MPLTEEALSAAPEQEGMGCVRGTHGQVPKVLAGCALSCNFRSFSFPSPVALSCPATPLCHTSLQDPRALSPRGWVQWHSACFAAGLAWAAGSICRAGLAAGSGISRVREASAERCLWRRTVCLHAPLCCDVFLKLEG